MAVKKKKGSDISAIVITVIAVLLAIAAVVFLIITISKDNNEQDPAASDATFQPTEKLLEDAELAAYDLLPKNYDIYRYLTLGMDTKKEPYGNKPEDGFYTCINEDFATFDEFCEFIRSVYTETTAEVLIANPFGNGPVYGDDNGELGLSDEFEPVEEDTLLSWENVNFTCSLVSATECRIEIILKDNDGNDVKKEVTMVMEDENWRLTELVY